MDDRNQAFSSEEEEDDRNNEEDDDEHEHEYDDDESSREGDHIDIFRNPFITIFSKNFYNSVNVDAANSGADFNSFNNRKTFSCPKIKEDFITGTNTSNLSPEDIGIIAALGDSLATGRGLYRADINFRGGAFPIGGDATIDGLITIPNILHEFNGKLVGASHGMGKKTELPNNQLNIAEDGATCSGLPAQAKELVDRINNLHNIDVKREWAMIIITIGTDEICSRCEVPNYNALEETLAILKNGISKAFVILLGPIHVSSSFRRQANLLKLRCACLREKSNKFMKDLSKSWIEIFNQLQNNFDRIETKRPTFSLLVLPMLTITSRSPLSLFIGDQPLLGPKGHAYATKWLWNRLITGPAYNLSLAVLSQDAYYCPSMVCPYFRTQDNRQYCRLHRYGDIEKTSVKSNRKMRRSRKNLYITALIVVLISFCSVVTVGSLLYQRSANHGRFESLREPETIRKHLSNDNSEERALL
ncbi:unnamed protein product [Dracunculus medinensis]|uniref:Lipase_GDSL domain-containing protein n=1 Tax=Dracunculus medinensis TaxID=318479 RepID=A0A158Q5C6_DRAME|nr:unnamed protein product [Dracunculus medinensis]